ncbi:molybdopterin converting factor subunit 1 [Oceanobacillus bengalensis]|uniref:Molybdopterin synthase sulfur carrier subunit n=1 Tax=Oceanobacillus bengalensis TaxID=1435466 RepID=A0A494Z4Y9_9BACI|nr:molybdopterin converting factor subunit 1 [Oceanobacillus bengalensis]RKQ17569.1 molybdopterin converting factor subunit 1 [Oceanobacillus bengalensis]
MIKILLFADLQEKVGKPELELKLEQITVEELKSELQKIYPLINLESVMTAVNEEYAMADDAIKSGDTVAFIPPVSGG